ncbi:Alb1-domain-containing protein [Dendryphion nanum]|uniref:Alb1-domain-containing protein n=1 Tax=Dendryphion nanum TaxID=256645 RepID=A0A9P9D744_9PLEO|nr:Alb1-domain-containing protein [Dendryphion nanum]
MAKTAKIKKRQSTLHSRAARRASPSLELAPTSKPAHKSPPPVSKPHVLAAKSGGIVKRSKAKPMKRQQRERQAKGMLRAEDNMEKLAQKVQKSLGKDKKVRERRKGWEEVNGDGVVGKKRKDKDSGANAFGALEEDEEDEERKVWLDEDMVDDEVEGEVKEVAVAESVPLPAPVEDEIL